MAATGFVALFNFTVCVATSFVGRRYVAEFYS